LKLRTGTNLESFEVAFKFRWDVGRALENLAGSIGHLTSTRGFVNNQNLTDVTGEMLMG